VPHRFLGLPLNALDKLVAGGDVVDEADDLACSPDLKRCQLYAVFPWGRNIHHVI
jgi:hypothetical protein